MASCTINSRSSLSTKSAVSQLYKFMHKDSGRLVDHVCTIFIYLDTDVGYIAVISERGCDAKWAYC